MKIAIIAHGLRAGGGISVAQNLISQLLKTAEEHTFLVSIPDDKNYEDISNYNNCQVTCRFKYSSKVDLYYYFDLMRRLFFEKVQLKKAIKEFNPDIVFCIGNMLPGRYQAKHVLFLQNAFYVYPFKDFIYTITLKELFITLLKRLKFYQDIKFTDLLICQTETMLNRTKRMYGFKGSTLICPNVLSLKLKEKAFGHDIAILEKLKDKKILFCLSDYYLHKNIEILIKLFSTYRDELKEYVLILTINPQKCAQAARLIASITENKLTDTIFNVGTINQKDICHYYRASTALIMPTLLESFSSTYIEAMLYNVPILTSDLDFARDICKEEAIYFNPNDIHSIFAAIISLQSNHVTFNASHHSLSLTWEDISKEILVAFEKIPMESKYVET